MSFLYLKKKKFKFQVNLEVEELSKTPFLNVILFAKISQKDGGGFVDYTAREEVRDNLVKWNKKCQLTTKMLANASTGVLEPCLFRISVRKELKGGKSFQKLGFANINLAEFAGSGYTTRKYLLEGYGPNSRLDNSMLQVNVEIKLLSGDPCFKVPRSNIPTLLPGEEDLMDLHPDNKGGSGGDDSEASVGESSGFGSLPRKDREAGVEEPAESRKSAAELKPVASNLSETASVSSSGDGGGTLTPATAAAGLAVISGDGKDASARLKESRSSSGAVAEAECGHSRNSSCASVQSKVSGYSSSHTATHSRQSSLDSSLSKHRRSYSTDSGEQKGYGSLGHRKKLEPASSIEKRMGSTRVDTDELIEEIIRSTDLQADDSAEVSGLQLFVGKDGSTVLGSQQVREKAGTYERVVFDQR